MEKVTCFWSEGKVWCYCSDVQQLKAFSLWYCIFIIGTTGFLVASGSKGVY